MVLISCVRTDLRAAMVYGWVVGLQSRHRSSPDMWFLRRLIPPAYWVGLLDFAFLWEQSSDISSPPSACESDCSCLWILHLNDASSAPGLPSNHHWPAFRSMTPGTVWQIIVLEVYCIRLWRARLRVLFLSWRRRVNLRSGHIKHWKELWRARAESRSAQALLYTCAMEMWDPRSDRVLKYLQSNLPKSPGGLFKFLLALLCLFE